MIAIDTNVLVRLLVGDDAAQARRARRLVEKSEVLVCSTVLLETEWVLRAAYGIEAHAISGAFRALLGLANVTPDSPAVAEALDGYDAGHDFADALHLASAHKADAFCTFDKRLARRAKGGKLRVEVVPA
ncbi:MAG TPA: type II toxin-antitoxin system VapC family toxin [Usitatibacter sp.]|nr:type II toxin-antitoxin system VapC family toxin [Usitatibacter sp.]